MSNYFTFTRKEITENLRTKRLLVLGCVFLSFAILSPLMARFMGEIFAMLIPSTDETGQALVAALSNPVWTESYLQFYGNLAQVGIFAIIFMYMSIIQREIKTGTANLMFSKGLGHTTFILSKFTVASIVIFIVTMVSVLVTYAYTLLLFDYGGQIGDVILGGLVFSAGAIALLAVIMMCSAVTKSTPASAGLSIGAYFIFVILGMLPRIGVISPTNLLGHPIALSTGTTPDDLVVNILLGVAVTIVALFFTTYAIAKAEG